MNAQPTLESVGLVPAITLWATTPVFVPLNTCRSMVETIAWVCGTPHFTFTVIPKNLLKCMLTFLIYTECLSVILAMQT